MIRKIDSNKFSLTILKVTTFSRIRHLFNEELNRVAWDQVCDGLTFSEKEICKLILQGHTLKEICAKLNKSESNITSQRCHIRKKLNMDRRDDLRRTLEVRFYDAQKQVKKSEAE